METMKTIEIVNLENLKYLDAVEVIKKNFLKRVPLIFRNLNIGKCVEKWKNNEYLFENDPRQIVSVHLASTKEMDFKHRNFEYKNMRMDDFIKVATIDDNEKYWYYLRALGADVRKEKAHFPEQFPHLAEDLLIPPVFSPNEYFSSVFRISSKNCRLWTHYDTMDNILIQVRGEKSIIFYSPFDAEYLYLEDGKSPILCPESCDLINYPLFAKATPFLGKLTDGDIVFIPALWFHNVQANAFSVAVNVFWYHLKEDLYDRKDVYGNKDPLPVTRVNQSIDNCIKTLSSLPEEYRHLYGLNLIKKLSSKLLKQQSD